MLTVLLLSVFQITLGLADPYAGWYNFEDYATSRVDQWIKVNEQYFDTVASNPLVSTGCKNAVNQFRDGLQRKDIQFVKSKC